jgi:uncharacterized protein Yka (UPF0111/DUF47 family)
MTTTEGEFGRRLVSETETHLDTVQETVARLRRVVTAYRTGEPYVDTVASVRDLESDCDRQNRRICGLITDSGPGDIGLARAQIHFNAESLVELYHRLDDVANAVERAVLDLTAIEPRPDDACLDGLVEMAECAVAAVQALHTATIEFIGVLCAPVESGDITDDVAKIRTTESRCDDLRTDVIAAAFREDATADSAAYRALAIQFDRVVDAAEDVTDRMCLLSRTIPKLTVEPHTTHP